VIRITALLVNLPFNQSSGRPSEIQIVAGFWFLRKCDQERSLSTEACIPIQQGHNGNGSRRIGRVEKWSAEGMRSGDFTTRVANQGGRDLNRGIRASVRNRQVGPANTLIELAPNSAPWKSGLIESVANQWHDWTFDRNVPTICCQRCFDVSLDIRGCYYATAPLVQRFSSRFKIQWGLPRPGSSPGSGTSILATTYGDLL